MKPGLDTKICTVENAHVKIFKIPEGGILKLKENYTDVAVDLKVLTLMPRILMVFSGPLQQSSYCRLPSNSIKCSGDRFWRFDN
jgi:hypothetical protein